MIRIGQGLDVHAFSKGRRLVLGGVEIPFSEGLAGHSDADVLTHAIMDAVIGALALGDIGTWFPDSDSKYKDADSIGLLRRVICDDRVSGWRLVNLDSTIIAQRPRLSGYIPEMRMRIAEAMLADPDAVSIKATTSERLGFCGRGEGIVAMANLILINGKAH